MYCTEPVAELLGLVSIWLMVFPDPALAPVILPIIVPIVQVKVLGAEAVRVILGELPLQIAAVFVLVTTGRG
jgi:hypothetical protein